MIRIALLRRAGFIAASLLTAAAANAMNVVFVMVDDLGWSDTTPYGATYYQTPSLGRLAGSGLRFTDAYAANPLCSPTRASVLSGQYPGRLGITTPEGHVSREVLTATMPDAGPSDQPATNGRGATRLRNETFTLGELFKSNGYRTAFMGKWHLGPKPYVPEVHGFDVVVGGREDPGPPAPGHFFAPWNRDTLPKVPPGSHITDVVTDRAIEFVTNSVAQKQPFFLCLWPYDVHAPFQGEPQLIEKYKALVTPGNPRPQPVMAAMIETMDRNIGRVLDALDQTGVANDTVVIFYSDNGGNMYDRVDGGPITSNAPLRGGKAMSYEGGVRVPLIVRWPGRTPVGVATASLVTSPDFLPTFVEGLGMNAPAELILDGKSFVPALAGEPVDRGPIFCHFPHYISNPQVEDHLNKPSTTIRRGDWKLHRYYADGPRQQDRFELYNLANDVGETTNLADANGDLVRELSELIDGHLERTGALRPVANPNYMPVARTSPGTSKPAASAKARPATSRPAAAKETAGWMPGPNGQATLAVEGGKLVVRSTGVDPFLFAAGLDAPAGSYIFVFSMRSDAAGKGKVYFTSRKTPQFKPEQSADFEPIRDAAAHEYRVAFRVDEPLATLRLDPAQAEGVITIDAIRLETAEGRVVKRWTFDGE